MRQSTLTNGLRLSAGRPPASGVDELIKTLADEENLAFVGVLPSGSILKCMSELLLRCAPNAPVTVDPGGMVFVACDAASGRLVHIDIRATDMLKFRFHAKAPLRSTIECSSLHSVFSQLKRKDQVVIYATLGGEWGSLVDYSAKRSHMKHNTICVRQQGSPAEYVIPSGYPGPGVPILSSILQRTFREYKHLSKRIILTGNESYAHFQTDARYSLHRSDNLFGVLDPREEDVAVELGIATLSRALKVTQFNRTVHVSCHPNLPVRLSSQLGRNGSTVSVFLQNEACKA
jgi:hypothetical protein